MKYAILCNYKPLTVIQNGHVAFFTFDTEEMAKQFCKAISCFNFSVGYMLIDEKGQAYLDLEVSKFSLNVIEEYKKQLKKIEEHNKRIKDLSNLPKGFKEV